MRKIILYIATSIDGFIARENGDIDWLPQSNSQEEDYGYKKLLGSVDTLLIGRKTYDQILSFGKWPYKGKKCYVFTNSNPKPDNNVEFINNPVSFIKELIKKDGKDIWLVGGSELNTLLINEGLIDEIILTITPVVLGQGIKIFNNIENDIKLKLKDSIGYNSGFTQLKYST